MHTKFKNQKGKCLNTLGTGECPDLTGKKKSPLVGYLLQLREAGNDPDPVSPKALEKS